MGHNEDLIAIASEIWQWRETQRERDREHCAKKPELRTLTFIFSSDYTTTIRPYIAVLGSWVKPLTTGMHRR